MLFYETVADADNLDSLLGQQQLKKNSSIMHSQDFAGPRSAMEQ